jgi:hypothetical protein
MVGGVAWGPVGVKQLAGVPVLGVVIGREARRFENLGWMRIKSVRPLPSQSRCYTDHSGRRGRGKIV